MVAFVASVQGETICDVESLLTQLGDVQGHVELCSRVSVEEFVVTHLESYIVLIAYLLCVFYNALAMVVVVKLVKAEFVISHARLLENLEHLDKTIVVLSRKFSSCSKSLDKEICPRGK